MAGIALVPCPLCLVPCALCLVPCAGARFRQAIADENPLQIVGTINAYSAMIAERTGFRVVYLSGAGVANASYGLPDLGLTSLNDVLATPAPDR